jgi:cap1 methyltransferase
METSTDPSSLLILLSTPPIPNPLEFLPTPYQSGTKRPVLKPQIKQASAKDVETAPPIYISSSQDYINFVLRKAEFSRFTREQLDVARAETNPYEGIGKSIFMNRASMKLANIDALYKLTHHLGAFMHLTTPGPFKFCDLAGAPGGFTNYIQWRRPEAMGYGISLKSTKPDVPTWNERFLDMHRFLPYYGDSGTGNLYIEWKNFVNRVKSDQVLGVDLVVADGGFDVETERAHARQEFLSFRLIMVQILTALKLLKPEANFVVKTFDTVTELTAQLLYITSLCFESITLFKPITSRPANAEKYLICLGKRKGTEIYEALLEQVNKSYNEDEVVTNLIGGPLPSEFTNWLTEANNALMAGQQQAVERMMEKLEGGTPEVPAINSHKALIIFNVPGAPVTGRSLVKVPGSARGTYLHSN